MTLSSSTGTPALDALRKAVQSSAWLEFWPVALAVGASMLLPGLLPLAVGTAALAWILRWARSGHLSVRTPADAPILVLAGMIPVTLWATALPETTLPQVLRLLTGIALYYAIANWARSPGRVRMLIQGAALAGGLLALAALVSVDWTPGKIPFIPRSIYDWLPTIVPDPIHRNVMAGALVILLPLPLAQVLFAWGELSGAQRALLAGTALTACTVLILTQSRGGLTALAALVTTLMGLRWRRGWLLVPGAALVLWIAAQAAGPANFLEFLSAEGTIGSIDGRVEIWSRALFMIQDFPFTGIGMGTFTRVADELYPFFLSPPGQIDHAHNLFLQVGVDLGIPGLIAWLAAWLVVSASAWGLYRRGRARGDGWVNGLGAGLLASQAALAVHGLTDAVTWGMVRPAPLVWGLWGLAVAGLQIYRVSSDD